MAKKSVEPKAAVKPAAPTSQESFVELMLVAADFAKASGGIEPAKVALQAAGTFICQAGGVDAASKALEVLESLKTKIG